MDLREKLELIRKSRNLSSKEMAVGAGVSYETLRLWQNGTNQPKINNLTNLANFLGIQPSFFWDKNITELTPDVSAGGQKKSKTQSESEIDIGNNSILKAIPFVEIFAYEAYLSNYSNNNFLSSLPKTSLIVNFDNQDVFRSFRVKGRNMDNNTRDSITSGDIVIGKEVSRGTWETRLQLHKFQDYIIIGKEGISIQRITSHNVSSGKILCSSINENRSIYPDYELKISDCYELYSIIKLERSRGN